MGIEIKRRTGLGARAGLGVALMAALMLAGGGAAQDATPNPGAEATPNVPDACETESPADAEITVGYAGLSGSSPSSRTSTTGCSGWPTASTST